MVRDARVGMLIQVFTVGRGLFLPPSRVHCLDIEEEYHFRQQPPAAHSSSLLRRVGPVVCHGRTHSFAAVLVLYVEPVYIVRAWTRKSRPLRAAPPPKRTCCACLPCLTKVYTIYGILPAARNSLRGEDGGRNT